MIEGVDYAGSHPSPGELFAAGKRFVVRYGGPGGTWKHLTTSEAHALKAAGLSIVANAEGETAGLLAGASAGRKWAQAAAAHFRDLGMPAGRPIYLSADWDVTAAQWPAVAEALRAAAGVVGAARVGVYGSYDAVRWARRDGVARWFWQTYAWSGGRWAAGNHIEQYRNGVSLAGGEVDLCRAMVSDYGQWGQSTVEEDMTPQELLDTVVHSPQLGDFTVADALKKAVATHAEAGVLEAKLDLLASRADIDPAELAAIGEQARQAAASALAGLDLDQLAERIAAKVPAADRAEIVAAVREVFADAGQAAPGEAGAGA